MVSQLQRELKQKRPFVSPGHEATVGLLRTTDVVRRHVGAVVMEQGVTLPQYNVLRILRGAGRDGLPISEIGERVMEQTPGITRMMDRLENKGWVRRERQTDDRRVVICTLTPVGRRLVDRLDQPVQAADDSVVAGLTRAETRELIRLLDKIRTHLP